MRQVNTELYLTTSRLELRLHCIFNFGQWIHVLHSSTSVEITLSKKLY